MRTIALFAICFASSSWLCSSAGAEDDDTKALLGQWRVVALEARGKSDSGVSFRGMRYKFDKKTWTTFPGTTTPAGIAAKPPLKLPYSVDNTKTPKHLNIVFKGSNASRTMKAIYKIQDGKLYICMGGVERPETFDTTGTKRGCYIAERIADPEQGTAEPKKESGSER